MSTTVDNGARMKQLATTAPKVSPLIALGQRFQIEPARLVEVLRGTVIKPNKNGQNATNEEVAAFCIVANQYGLNPFTREIHAFVSGDKGVVPIVGIDGWAKIVNTHGAFDGCEFVEESDEEGHPVSITCVMHVKGQNHPVRVPERFSECKRNTIPWNTMPWRMLRHKAFMQAARYAFGLSGIYDEDEARDIVKNSPVIDTMPEPSLAEKIKGKKKAAPAEPVDAEFTEPATAPDGEITDAAPPPIDDAEKAAIAEQAEAPEAPQVSSERTKGIEKIRKALKKTTGMTEKFASNKFSPGSETFEQLSDEQLAECAAYIGVK